MKTLDIPAADQEQLFKLLSALILLRNVEFIDEDDKADFKDIDALKAAEEMLGCGKLNQNLTTKKISRGAKSGRASVYTVDYTKQQAEMVRDAVIKSIYLHVFDWVVEKVNAFITGSEAAPKLPYVGLLDIFGFENFKFNSFEQLCINFANEKLQQFFLVQVLKTEEELHVKEGVTWKEIEFQVLAPCVEMGLPMPS